MPRSRLPVSGLLLLVAVLPGCADRSTAASGEGLAVTAGPGPQPVFAWSPGVPVQGVTVTLRSTGAVVWAAHSPAGANAIAPPVLLGTTPEGAIHTANLTVTHLERGVRYRVSVARYGDDGVLRTGGARDFAP